MSAPKKFFCQHCNHHFSSQGKKQEWTDPVLGACWNWQAKCPQCGQWVKEEKKPLSSKGSVDAAQPAAQSCLTGTCPFVN